jgi:hypothetical protein
MMNKHGRVVSRSKHSTAKRERRLEKAGFFTKKGQFGFIKNGKTARRGKRGSKRMKGGMQPLSPTELSEGFVEQYLP